MIPLTQLAHVGHTLIDLAMFAPVIGLAIWFVVVGIRDRRAGTDRDD
ncbi:MAG: hypothetical protein WDZ37_04655 [Solirubrobacterales bacterium]